MESQRVYSLGLWTCCRSAGITGLLATFVLSAAAAPPDCPYNVANFGAAGGGATLDTSNLQAAIDACAAAGGGTVYFPPGRYLTGTLFLKDNVCLELDRGAVILGSPRLEDYPATRCEFPSRTDFYTARALIWGENLHDVAITGLGTIDGQGAHFCDKVATPTDMADVAAAYTSEGRYTPHDTYFNRPYLIRLISCRNVLVENVNLRNSAMWMQHYLNCDFVTIRGINVFNHACANNDMIDIDSCRNVIISDCFGDSDDDALTLKSTGNRPTEHVTITNCILRSHCNALKAGTESAGGFKDIAISNCVIQRSSVPKGVAGRPEGLAGIALEIVDGGTLERVTISNIIVEGTNAPIFMRLGDRGRPDKPSQPKPPVGRFRDVTISNITATGASKTGCAIAGLPGHPIENVTLSNIHIAFNGGGTAEEAGVSVEELESNYPESTMFGVLPAYAFFCRHVDGLTLQNVEVYCEAEDLRPALVLDDVHDLRLDALKAKTAPAARAQLVLRNCADALISGCVAEGTNSFLALEGTCAGIRAVSNDLRNSTHPFSIDAATTASALTAEYNLLPDK